MMQNFDLNNIKIDKKSYKSILIYYIGYFTIIGSKYVKTYSVNTLYLIINKVNGYFEEIKYLTLVPANESKEKAKKYEELSSKIRYLIRSMTKNRDYDEKHMKINLIRMPSYV